MVSYKRPNLRKIRFPPERVILGMSLPYFQVVCHMPVLNFIDDILYFFESCFSRKAAFRWVCAYHHGIDAPF